MNRRLAIALGFAFILLLLNSAYVAGFSTPSIFYMANVLLHLCLGLALAIGLIVLLLREPVFRRGISGAAMWFAAALGFALYLVASRNTSDHRWDSREGPWEVMTPRSSCPGEESTPLRGAVDLRLAETSTL